MAQAVSNLTRFVSFTPTKASNDPKKLTGFARRSSIKAMAGNGKDNLDHLQRTNGKEHQTTQPPKKRLAPVAPVGK